MIRFGAGGGSMNFPCQNCKAIRPFSGEPLKCEVCGWESNAASHPRIDPDTQSKGDVLDAEPALVWTGEEAVGRGNLLRVAVWGFLIVGVVFLAFHFGAGSLFQESGKRREPPGQYALALKYHLTMEQVIMDPKPLGCDFTDAPIGQKHCHFEQDLNVVRECLTPNCPVKRVYVSWRKVRDSQ